MKNYLYIMLACLFMVGCGKQSNLNSDSGSTGINSENSTIKAVKLTDADIADFESSESSSSELAASDLYKCIVTIESTAHKLVLVDESGATLEICTTKDTCQKLNYPGLISSLQSDQCNDYAKRYPVIDDPIFVGEPVVTYPYEP